MTANRFDQLIDKFEPVLRKAFLEAVTNMRSRVDIGRLTAMLEQRDLAGALQAVGLDPVSFRVFDKAVAEAFEAGGVATASGLPARRGGGLKTTFQFNIRNPQAERFLRDYSGTMIRGIVDDQRQMIRAVMQDGLSVGAGPRTTALDIAGRIDANGKRSGGLLGLTDSQAQWARNYEAELLSDNPRAALARNLRDKRFDRAVTKAAEAGEPVPANLRDKMVLAYRNRALRYRAETIARKETITALHVAQDEAMRQAIESGAIDAAAVTYIWRAAKDKRTREAHRDLNGETAAQGEYFQSSLGPIRYPGDPDASAANTVNCRCWREPVVDFLRGVR